MRLYPGIWVGISISLLGGLLLGVNTDVRVLMGSYDTLTRG